MSFLREGASFDDHMVLLAVLLMQQGGYRIDVNVYQIDQARRFLRDNRVQLVEYQFSRLTRPDEVTIELRYKSDGVVQGEVVQEDSGTAKPGGSMARSKGGR